MEIEHNIIKEFKDIAKEDVEFDKKCSRIVHEIKSGRLTVLQLVEQLGELLVDVSSNNRELGTWILTHVLEGLPSNHFDSKQLNFICTFYADRLKDHHQVVPAVIKGILVLTKFEQFPDGAATQILSTLFQHVSCQQQQQKDRHNIYSIFSALLNKQTTELCTMALDFVYGVISAVDGERDPNNLTFLFNWFPKFLTTVKLGHLTEECFEILACYFPVDFKSPAQDPNSVTRDKLAEALAPCLTAIPEFANFCLPLALEKLDSSLQIAKLDSLKLLEVGCGSFDVTSYVQHSTEIWSQIQKELFNNPSQEVEIVCLSTISAVIKKISRDPSASGTVKDISDTVKRNLIPDSKLFEPSWKLLLSVAKASEISCDLISRDVVPILVNTFSITLTPLSKVVVLRVLVDFFHNYAELHNEIQFEELNKIPILCLKSVVDENIELQVTGFEGLGQIVRFLSPDLRFSLFNTLQNLLIIPQNEIVRASMLKCFNELAKNFPQEIKEKVLNVLQVDNLSTLQLYLDTLCVIASQNYFSNYVIDVFINQFKENSITSGSVTVNALKNLLNMHENNMDIQNILLEKDLINILVNWCLQNENFEQITLENVSFIIKTITGNQNSTIQREIVKKNLTKIKDLSKPQELSLLDGILCRLQRDVEINYNILDELTKLALKKDNEYSHSVAVQLLANLINKCVDEHIIESYLSQIEQNTSDVSLLPWLTKALVMRNHTKANIWTQRLIAALKNDASVAKAFRIIINDNNDYLSEKSHCVKTVLYQQKFFILVTNQLCEEYQPELQSFLVALGYLLEHTPRQVILLHFNKILKLFILCLETSKEVEVLLVLLKIIKDFLTNREKCIEQHLNEFLNCLLKLATFEKSMKIRIMALKCLQEYTSSFPLYKLLPHKMQVLSVLNKAIDDRKRIVRKEAVEARSLWLLLDAPM